MSLATPYELMQNVSSFLAETFQVQLPVKVRQKRQLECWRGLCMRRWLYHQANICQTLHRSPKCLQVEHGDYFEPHHRHSTNVVVDLDTQPLLYSNITSILSSCPPSVLAELREWQKATHILACIDTAIPYISNARSQTNSPPDPLTDLICSTMVSTIHSLFPSSDPSSSNLQPAQPHPSDPELVMSRRVFSDEPQMQTMLSSLDETNRRFLEEAAERERAHLPLFPSCFREEAETRNGVIKLDKDDTSRISNKLGRWTDEKEDLV